MAHPVVGPGLETILRLEQCDVRRTPLLAGAHTLRPWTPDIALIDGVLLGAERVTLGVPSLVLAGSALDGEALRTRVDDARGWLRKDATAEELEAPIARALGAGRANARLRRGALIAAAAAAAVIFLVLGMLVARGAG